MEKFWVLDHSEVDSFMRDRYSNFVPEPRLPFDMLCSIQLSVKYKITSYTNWAADLKGNHLHAILSGFTVSNAPDNGTFYNSQKRLWLSDNKIFFDPVHPPMQKPKNPDKKGQKTPFVEKISVKDLLEQFELKPPHDMEPCRQFYEIFKVLFLDCSAKNGLIDLMNLSLAGDGTPVYTATQERKKRTCNCLENKVRDCTCDRIYIQPDCNIGWDSHRECYYFGYDLYMLTASDSENDLPVFPFLGPASRHDSIEFLYNWYSMKQFLPRCCCHKVPFGFCP